MTRFAMSVVISVKMEVGHSSFVVLVAKGEQQFLCHDGTGEIVSLAGGAQGLRFNSIGQGFLQGGAELRQVRLHEIDRHSVAVHKTPPEPVQGILKRSLFAVGGRSFVRMGGGILIIIYIYLYI